MKLDMNLDVLVGIIDQMIEDGEIQILLTSEEGTQEVKIKSNHGLGSIVDYYLICQALKTAVKNLYNQMELLGKVRAESFVDGLLEILRNDLIIAFRETKGGE